MNQLIKLFFTFLFLITFTGCIDSNIKSMAEVTGLDPTAPPPRRDMKPQILETPTFYYPHGGRRDPFAPLVGNLRPSLAEGISGNEGLSQSDIANLVLRGIMRDQKGKIALISSTNGDPYTLRSGRIYDKKNRRIKGMAGIIKDKSVVLISKDRLIKELTIRGE